MILNQVKLIKNKIELLIVKRKLLVKKIMK